MNTDTTTNRLGYGLRDAPTDAPAAWGARLIFPNDLVWDRTDMYGEQEDKNRLLDWLNTHAPRIGSDDFLNLVYRNTSASGEHVFTIAEDDTAIMQASAQGSYGYLYVAAWLKA